MFFFSADFSELVGSADLVQILFIIKMDVDEDVHVVDQIIIC